VDPGDDGHTNVRLQIANTDSLTGTEREAIKSIVTRYRDSLSEYEWRLDRKKNIAVKTVWHGDAAQDPSYNSYLDAIVSELLTLTETFHPIFVNNPVE
jgi:hypothetical protein